MSIVRIGSSTSINDQVNDQLEENLFNYEKLNNIREREMPRLNETTFYSEPAKASEYDRAMFHAFTGQNLTKRRKVQEFNLPNQNEKEESCSTSQSVISLDHLRKRIEALTVSKVLDCPEMLNDFYVNLISFKDGVVDIGINNECYLYPLSTNTPSALKNGDNESVITAVELIDNNNYTALGRDPRSIQIYNNETKNKLRTIQTESKVNKIFYPTGRDGVVLSGELCGKVSALDLRIQNPVVWSQSHNNSNQAVCNITESGNKLAIGGNNNEVKIWDWRQIGNTPLECATLPHNAAIKALSWSPQNNQLLATGAGSADRNIRIWNTNTNKSMSQVDTGSQVCHLSWNDKGNQLVSTHGYGANNDEYIKVWHYNKNNHKLTHLGDLKGHKSRVNQAAMDGGILASVEPEAECMHIRPLFDNPSDKNDFLLKKPEQNPMEKSRNSLINKMITRL